MAQATDGITRELLDLFYPFWSPEFEIFALGGQRPSIGSANDEPESVVTSADVLDMNSQAELDASVALREARSRFRYWDVLFSEPGLEIGTGRFNGVDYVTRFEQLHGGILGNPAAAKDAVENLPSIVFVDEEHVKTCAVCKDEMGAGQDSNVLPCKHRYHRDCIIPWLGIRNTCPLCRFELPTDDAEYETRRQHLSASLLQ